MFALVGLMFRLLGLMIKVCLVIFFLVLFLAGAMIAMCSRGRVRMPRLRMPHIL